MERRGVAAGGEVIRERLVGGGHGKRETEEQREKEVIKKIGRGKTREKRNRGAEGERSDQKNGEGEDQRGEKQRSRGRRK